MSLQKAVESNMFPHFLSTLLWILLIASLAFNLNFSVVVTGAVANGGYKVIMFFHLWMFLLPVLCYLMFYRIRREGIIERYITRILIIAILFSILNLSLRFVDDFMLLTKASEVTAWSLYNLVSSISIYKILIVFLSPVLGKSARVEKETFS